MIGKIQIYKNININTYSSLDNLTLVGLPKILDRP